MSVINCQECGKLLDTDNPETCLEATYCLQCGPAALLEGAISVLRELRDYPNCKIVKVSDPLRFAIERLTILQEYFEEGGDYHG